MANIVTKLNLNRTPSIVANNSMVFAKNIRIDIDGTIHKDYSIKPLNIKNANNDSILHSSLLNRIIADYNTLKNNDGVVKYFRKRIENKGFNIIDIIADSTTFYILVDSTYENVDIPDDQTEEVTVLSVTHYYSIIKYDEDTDLFTPCDCNWTWSGGDIDGYVVNNLLNETILVIGERGAGLNVPLKCINLAHSSYTDDESLYTQTPNIPITNLTYAGRFNYTIPNGVYQFYVRYKIRNGFYTDWFPASRELFAGNKNVITTSFGTVKHLNKDRDSDDSFVFNVIHLLKNEYANNYESFQLGFILSHDDTVVARSWKHFDFSQSIINFDYNANDSKEIEVTDLTKVTFQLYNVGNITSFKNKLYISNYKETDFNDDSLKDSANKVTIKLKSYNADKAYGNYSYTNHTIESNGNTYISGFDIDNTYKAFTGQNGIIDTLMNTDIKDVLSNALSLPGKQTTKLTASNDLYDLHAQIVNSGNNTTIFTGNIDTIQNKVTKYINNNYNNGTVTEFSPAVVKVTVNNNTLEYNTLEAIRTNIYNTIRYLNNNAIFTNSNYSTSNTFVVRIYRYVHFTKEEYVPIPYTEKTTTSESKSTIIDLDNNILIPIDQDKTGNTSTIKTVNDKLLYCQEYTISFIAYKDKLNIVNTDENKQYTTLIPYQKYKFYIHFVKSSGEITNGYYCDGVYAGEKSWDNYESDCGKIIYPEFNNIIIPDGYVACFFSILHTSINTAVISNITYSSTTVTDKTIHYTEGICTDINIGLYKVGKNFAIKGKTKTYKGNYYYCGNYEVPRYFGANGIIAIEGQTDNDNITDATTCGTEFGNHISGIAYITQEYTSSQAEDVELIKCTPYINKNNSTVNTDTVSSLYYSNYVDLNLGGYICQIYNLDKTRCIEYYTDGTESASKKDSNYSSLNLTELGKYNDSTEHITSLGLINSDMTTVYSNYNLNYLTLSIEPKQVVKTWYSRNSSDTSNNKEGYNCIWRIFPSLNMSEIYKLHSMYKSYTRKTYLTYNIDDVVEYNNTVRSSTLEGDEVDVSIFKFNADDYYNIPTNRGNIINLVSIGDAILVHTKDSMFKFTGSNNLQSTIGEIQTVESEVFNTGVSEVFGSDFGFAGLQDKRNSIITENGYIFYDKDSNVIYLYSGNNQITKLNDSIEKLFRYNPTTNKTAIYNVYFANDYYNNRFFMCIWFQTDSTTFIPVTLSFNFNEKCKAFVSLHDFAFTKAFNTKATCYFITNTTINNDSSVNICTIDKHDVGAYFGLEILNDKFYPSAYTAIKMPFSMPHKSTKTSTQTTLTMNYFSSIVDIIDNTNFEAVKTLNSINWCSNYVTDEFPIVNDYDDDISMVNGEVQIYPADKIKLYTDTCATKELDLTNIANNSSITNPNSYMYPRYNQGYWSLNYFRNIYNATDKFNYLSKYDDRRTGAIYRSDENSLIEGRYFVARFVFDGNNDFKLETVNFNYNNKL